MVIDNYLRMALMFGENKAQTFSKNLERMIILVLFEFEKEAKETHINQVNDGLLVQEGLNVVEIIEQLQARYSLNFSDSEVLDVINKKGQSRRIICIEENKDSSLNKYAITPLEYENVYKRYNESKIDGYIETFLKNHSDINFCKEEMLEILNKHFYTVFNSNAATILDLITNKYDYTQYINTEKFEFSIDEKEAINQFLYWNEPEKNKCVYEMVSCCFDYCMMTTRKDSNSFKNIFNHKVFFLDANIIFRLMGLNLENRKKVIETFIRKCKEQKVSVKVTNFTLMEVSDTISYHVQSIKNLLKGKAPLTPRAVFPAVNDSFYQAYYDWCQDSINTPSDYQGFARDLKKQAHDILYQFDQESFDNFYDIERETFLEYTKSLSDYKTSHGKRANENTVRTDVNNFMHVSKCNSKTKGENFFSIHNYLISADHTFGEWAKNIRPGTIPIVVLPSVWYSIMLQYSGRTDDDYASFTSFLNFSLSNIDSATNFTRKMEILRRVIEIDEPAKIQSEIVYGIEEKLKQENIKDLDSDGWNSLVDDVHQGIISREIDTVRDEEQRAAKVELDKYKAQTQSVISRSEQDLYRLKNENDQLKQQVENEKVMKEEEIRQSKEDAEKEHKRMIEHIVYDKTTETLNRYWALTIIMIAISLVIIIAIAFWVSKQETLSEQTKIGLEWINKALSIIAFLGNSLIIGIKFKGLNREKIEAEIRKQVEKDYAK